MLALASNDRFEGEAWVFTISLGLLRLPQVGGPGSAGKSERGTQSTDPLPGALFSWRRAFLWCSSAISSDEHSLFGKSYVMEADVAHTVRVAPSVNDGRRDSKLVVTRSVVVSPACSVALYVQFMCSFCAIC
uniref:Uncharacterized protein n=1 Tax=Noctiluca scintillans TaxID=2966 RepID=A0A7S1AVA3_NOCSC|mmetsp:Transcript_60734/g.161347  ORF Transcript_60734/g.161347 Transcript_60734/m.161347 type:complete len:132 (+) Transcript_60734:154-549(+)